VNGPVTSPHKVRRVTRTPILAVIGAALVVGGLADRAGSGRAAASPPLIQPMPVAPPASALSSTWFCAGASGHPHQMADGALVVANTGGRPLTGAALLLASQGRSVEVPFRVGASSRTSVDEAPAGDSPFVGALVRLDGGAAGVEQVVTGAEGVSTSACATTGSDHWYFADGTTQENSSLFISLVNPYPEDAIADLSFWTEQGSEAPADFQGVVVPARGVIGLDIRAHLRRRAQVATTVSVRAGRVAAFKTQVVNPPPPGGAPGSGAGAKGRVPGLSLVLGAPSTATQLWWPAGLTGSGFTERYQIYNPSQTPAEVSLRVDLDEGMADPFAIRIPPGATQTVVSNAESRIPRGMGHGAELVSTNGTGVVAERTVDASSPSTATGLADVGGSRLQARRWLLASGSSGSSLNESIVVFNPGTAAVDVSVASLNGEVAAINGLADLSLPPGRRLVLPLQAESPALDRSLVVEASGNVIVERDMTRVRAVGIDATIGIPLLDAP
jgi:hypothetical protein